MKNEKWKGTNPGAFTGDGGPGRVGASRGNKKVFKEHGRIELGEKSGKCLAVLFYHPDIKVKIHRSEVGTFAWYSLQDYR